MTSTSTDVIEGKAVASSARELSKEELQEAKEAAFALEQEIKGAIQNGRQAMWDLARALYHFNESSGWIALGYESQGEWLAQPEVSMSKRQYHRMVRLYKETVVVREIPEERMAELEPSKVEIVLPAIEANTATVDKALEDAESMGVRDLRETYIGPQSAPRNGSRSDASQKDASGATATDAPGSEGPQTAKEASKAGKGGKEAEEKPDPALLGAMAFDSWVELGGDRRKGVRGWRKLVENHPTIIAIARVQAFADGETFEGEEITKEHVKAAWAEIVRSLGLEVD